MPALTLILVLLGAAAALNVAAQRLHIPHPVLLVLGGLVLAFVPRLPTARLDPEVVFLIFVPPLVYRAALTTSWRDFREHLRSILLLAIGLVLVTTIAIAFVARQVVPALPWMAALLLGAIVAPSDPVAAIATIRRLDTPRSVDTILAGEGLVNDATALVAYRMTVDAVTSGRSLPLGGAVVHLVLAGGGGIAIGLAVGAGIGWLRRHLEHAPEVENTISLLTPFAAFIPADRLGASGVLAVVAVGLYLGREGPRIVDPETRIQAGSMWDMLTFVLEGLIFILVGLDLPLVTRDLAARSMSPLIAGGLLISAVAIGVRLLWIFPFTYLPRLLDGWARHRPPEYPPWGRVFFVGWAGMRGADSLVIALALPFVTASGRPFPARSAIIFVTFVVILVTLVAQGVTVGPLIRLLHLDAQDDDEKREEHIARLRTAKAGVARLDRIIARNPTLAAAARRLRARHIHRLRQHERRQHDHDDKADADAARRVRADMIDAERRELVKLRDRGVIGDDVLRVVQHDLDLEQMLVGASDETIENAHEERARAE
jgi:CPA1 family monovalent cation:H+ antiporter